MLGVKNMTYKPHPNGVIEINLNLGFDELFNTLDASFNYFNSWPNEVLPEYNLPYKLDSILPPKNYLLLEKIDDDDDIKFLEDLLNYQDKFSLVVEGILLISKNWLALDEHKIVKADGEINYIFLKNKLYKVFDQQIDILKLQELNDIGPNSWLWKIKI